MDAGLDQRHVLFASDNYAGVHPAVLEAIAEANVGFAPAYGDDRWTFALRARLRELLGDVEVFPVFNGTGGNVTSMAAVLRPFEAVVCPVTAHINVDECGAPERFAGCKLVDLPTDDGKLTPDMVEAAVVGIGDQHHVQAKLVSVSQVTELGTVYTADELAALAETAHRQGLLLHVDGARLPNAAESLGVDLRAITTDCGVDLLTFGGTKNGLLGAEAVVFLRSELAGRYPFVRKQGMQLASKMRFVSAQLLRLLENDLWRETAGHANAMARRLADGVSTHRRGAHRVPRRGERRLRGAAQGRHRAAAGRLPLLRVGRGGRRRPLDVLVADDRGRRRRLHRRARAGCRFLGSIGSSGSPERLHDGGRVVALAGRGYHAPHRYPPGCHEGGLMSDAAAARTGRWTSDPQSLPSGVRDFPAIMGWGGVVLTDESVDVVDLTREFAARVAQECCGQCFPCRIGMHRVSAILESVGEGRGRADELDELRSLCAHVAEAARCELGRSGAAAVLGAVDDYAERFAAAVGEHRAIARGDYASVVVAPCMAACPAGVDIPAYVEQLRIDEVDRSAEAVRRRCPMPATIGRVCVRPCEDACRRGSVDEPIAIRTLKRFVADSEPEVQACPVAGPARVGIVGAGPAGLACAYYLAVHGVRSTVFEALPEPGGMAAVGIPDYRLPRQVLRAEVARVETLGVEIRYNQRFGVDLSFDDLFSQGYGAVFVAVGAHQSASMGCEGEDAGYEGFMPGVEFLREVAFGRVPLTGETMLVIGGGNVAMDCVRTARRLGFTDVHLLYRRTEMEMPADRVEIEEAKEEGVRFETLVAPVQILAEDGRVTGLECRRMQLGEPDASGRRRPEPVPDSDVRHALRRDRSGDRTGLRRRRGRAREGRGQQVEDARGRPRHDAVRRPASVRRGRLLHRTQQPGGGAGRRPSRRRIDRALPADGLVRAARRGPPRARHARRGPLRGRRSHALHGEQPYAAAGRRPTRCAHPVLRRGRGGGHTRGGASRGRALSALLSDRRGGASKGDSVTTEAATRAATGTLTIDGRVLAFEPGQTILDVAEAAGIAIPTLCYLPQAGHRDVCRICVVDVAGAGRLLPACSTPATDGMVVETANEHVRTSRRTTLELLIGSGRHTCITCEALGSCRLSQLAYDYGVEAPKRLPEGDFPRVEDDFLVRDYSKCILCGRCWAACTQIQVHGVVPHPSGRRAERHGGRDWYPLPDVEQCDFCGQCVDACPVGALTERRAQGAGRTWELERVRTTCPHCGMGCQTVVYVGAGEVVKVTGAGDAPPNRGRLCRQGRFAVYEPDERERLDDAAHPHGRRAEAGELGRGVRGGRRAPHGDRRHASDPMPSPGSSRRLGPTRTPTRRRSSSGP